MYSKKRFQRFDGIGTQRCLEHMGSLILPPNCAPQACHRTSETTILAFQKCPKNWKRAISHTEPHAISHVAPEQDGAGHPRNQSQTRPKRNCRETARGGGGSRGSFWGGSPIPFANRSCKGVILMASQATGPGKVELANSMSKADAREFFALESLLKLLLLGVNLHRESPERLPWKKEKGPPPILVGGAYENTIPFHPCASSMARDAKKSRCFALAECPATMERSRPRKPPNRNLEQQKSKLDKRKRAISIPPSPSLSLSWPTPIHVISLYIELKLTGALLLFSSVLL